MTLSMDRQDLHRRAADIAWYHTMDLGHGLRVQGETDPAQTLVPRLRLLDVHGKSVLDNSAWEWLRLGGGGVAAQPGPDVWRAAPRPGSGDRPTCP